MNYSIVFIDNSTKLPTSFKYWNEKVGQMDTRNAFHLLSFIIFKQQRFKLISITNIYCSFCTSPSPHQKGRFYFTMPININNKIHILEYQIKL